MWLTFLTFDLSMRIDILHAVLAVSMLNILLVQRAERADSLGMAGGLS